MKRLLSLALSATLALALVGCGSSSGFSGSKSEGAMYSTPSAAPMAPMEMMDMNGLAEESAAGAVGDITPAGRKIIYHANLTLETKNYNSTCTALRQAAAEAGGYMESTNEYGSAEYGNRSAYFCFRIPTDKYRSFLGTVDESGSVVRRSESTEDITSSYVDVEARIASLEAQKAKLEELRDKAETLDDLLTIEERISNVQYQLESYIAQRRLYDNQVDYCTVNVSVDEVAVYTPVNTFGSRIRSAFGDSLDEFTDFLEDLAIFIIYALPYLILLVILLAIVRLIIKKLPKRAPRQPKQPKAKKGAANTDYAPLYAPAKNEADENADPQ